MFFKKRNHRKILKLCDKGDALLEKNEFEQANLKYKEALELVPEPKNEWEASTWIYTALGDSHYLSGDYKTAIENLYEAMNCPGGIANPFVLLRLGQCMLECGETKGAREYLLRAYMLEGDEIFRDEDDKYYKLIEDLVKGKKEEEETTPPKIKIELEPTLEKEIDILMNRAEDEFNKGDHKKTIDFLLEAWDKLPEPKGEYSESYHIVHYVSSEYLRINDVKNAKIWSEKIYECGLHRIDTGEREFLSGRVAFQAGEFEEAKRFFSIAYQKSDGRCFKGKEKKYYKFFKKK